MNLKKLIVIPFLFLAARAGATSMTLTHVGRANVAAASSFTRIQSSCTATAYGVTAAITFNSSVTGNASHGIIFYAADGGDAFSSLVDTGHNNYVDPSGGGIIVGGSARVNIWFATATWGGLLKATLTTSGSPNVNVCMEEISGATMAYTKFVTATQAATSAISTGNVTTLEPDFCAAIMTHSTGGVVTLTPTSGTPTGGDNNNSAHQAYNAQDMTHSAGTFASTWTSGSNVTPASFQMCFK